MKNCANLTYYFLSLLSETLTQAITQQQRSGGARTIIIKNKNQNFWRWLISKLAIEIHSRNWRHHARSGHGLEELLDLRRAMNKLVLPEVVRRVLDQLDEGDEQPWNRKIVYDGHTL